MLKGEHIFLRPIEPKDATRVVLWENDVKNWRVTGTEAPYSLHTILQHIDSIQNFRESGELRLMICLQESERTIGTLDVYDANFKHERAQVGILIGEYSERNKGYALEALELLKEYAIHILAFHSLTASIQEDNSASIALFEKAGYQLIGTRKGWYKEKTHRVNERIYQLCLNEN